MEQLKMYWENDGTPALPLEFPEGFTMVTMPELENGVEQWLEMMQYGLSEKREDASFYKSCMLDLPNYEEDKCFFIVYGGKAIATLTVVCDPETKDGLIHMVGSLPESRGKGVGNMLVAIADHVLKTTGMQTARPKTDDFRVPAIKTYLRIGFKPDLSTEDYVQRWDAICKNNNIRL